MQGLAWWVTALRISFMEFPHEQHCPQSLTNALDSFLKSWGKAEELRGISTFMWRIFSKRKVGSMGHRIEEKIIASGLCQVQCSGSVDSSADWIDLPGTQDPWGTKIRPQDPGNSQVTIRIVICLHEGEKCSSLWQVSIREIYRLSQAQFLIPAQEKDFTSCQNN